MEKWMSDAIDKALELRNAIEKSGVYLDVNRIEITYIDAVELCIEITPIGSESNYDYAAFRIRIVDDGYAMTRTDDYDDWHNHKNPDEIVDICKKIYFW